MNYNVHADIDKLKSNILRLVAKELEEFHAATGLTPSAVSIRFADIASGGMPTREHAICGVDVRFDF